MNPSELETEEDCHEELAAERHMQKTVGEDLAAKNYAVETTLHYGSVGDMQQGLLYCLQDAARDASVQWNTAIDKDTNGKFVRAIGSALRMRSLQIHHPSEEESGTIGQALSPGDALQPPTYSKDKRSLLSV